MITAVITKKGRILQNKQLNGADLTFTRVVASTANTPLEELQDKISVTSVAQTLSIQSITQDEKEQSYTILVLLENTTLTKSYNLNQIGFYAKDPNDGEILFAIAQFDAPKKIEIPTVEPGYTLEMPFIFQNSNSANVVIDFDPDNLMSRAGVQAMLDSEEISGKASGNVISLFDGSGNPFLDFNLFGKSEQVVTKGYQLFDASKLPTKTQGGATVTNNGDGSFTISGSGTLTDNFVLSHTYTSDDARKLLKAGDLYLSQNGTVYPRVVINIYYDDANRLSLDGNSSRNITLTNEILNKSDFALHIIISGVTGQGITKGTIKPMLHQDGDGTWEPFSGCKPAPNPEHPQEITSTGEDGSVDLNAQGKNLWTVTNTNENLTYDAATQIMTINGAVNLTVHELLIPIPKGTTVTISAEVISGVVTSKGDGGLAFGGYYKPEKGNASWQGYINIPSCSVQNLTGQKYKEIFETTEEVTHFYAFVYSATASIHEPLKVKVQYEINNYATDFEPHKDQTQFVGIPTPNGLHGIPVASGGNYTDKDGQQWICDEINLAKRKYIQRIYEYEVTGAENWTVSGIQQSKDGFTRFDSKAITSVPGAAMNDSVWPHFPYRGTYITDGYAAWTYSDMPTRLTLRIIAHYTTVEELLAFIAEQKTNGTPVKVKYVMATPIETDLTDEQIAALESLTTYDGATTILMDGIGNMEVQYFKDTDNGKAMGLLKSEHNYLKKLIGDINAVVKGLVG